jgi:D-alanyl-D-alanine carboxypeptidase
MRRALVFAFAFAARVGAQPAHVPKSIDAYLEPYLTTRNFSGQLLVMRGGGVVYERAVGTTGGRLARGNTPETMFHVASVSSQITAAAVMRLVDAGKLSLSSHVSDVVPDVNGGDRITIRDLLEQRSGLSDINARADYADILKHRQTPASLVAFIARDSLQFEPGTKYLREEHSAYNLLALIIEKKTGLSFAQAVTTLVFRPIGMRHSAIDDDAGLCALDAAIGNDPVGVSDLGPTAPIHWSAKAGNASLCTTARDHALWIRALFHGDFLAPASRAAIVDSTSFPFGYGWFRRKNIRFNQFAYSMSGRSPGFASYVLYLPREDLTVIALSNIYSSSTSDIANDVAAIALGLPYTPFVLRQPLLAADAIGVTGARFSFPADFYQPNAVLSYDARGSELFLRWPSGDRSPLIPMDRDHLVDRAYWEPISITRDSTGRPIAMTYDRFRGARVETSAPTP